MSTVSTERLAKIFVEVADTLVGEFDLITFLQLLADGIAGLIDDATVGLLLADPRGRLHFMAASDETTKFLEMFQADKQDGPCVDAFHDRAPVINTDLREAAERWPQFAPYATEAGFRSVHAFPLRLRDQAIGAMGVFGTTVGDFDDTDVQIVQSLADVAAISLLQQRSITHGELFTEQLQAALNDRIIIEQAKGTIAQAHNVTIDEAFQLLRAHARDTQQHLTGVARQAIDDWGTLPTLTSPTPTAPSSPT